MLDKLKTIETRYEELMALVSDASVQADPNQYRIHAKAQALENRANLGGGQIRAQLLAYAFGAQKKGELGINPLAYVTDAGGKDHVGLQL